MLFRSGGGGGWGDPLTRPPQEVLSDVVDEYVTKEGALRDYGVVLTSDGSEVDVKATERERSRLRKRRVATPELANA